MPTQTCYPIEVTTARLQEFLATTTFLMERELERNSNFHNPADNAIAVMLEMALNGKTAEDLTAWLRTSAEWQARIEKAIGSIYQKELGRDPDAGGLAGWVEAVRGGKALEDVNQAIHDSPEGVEYRTRTQVGRPLRGPLRVVTIPVANPKYAGTTVHGIADDTGLRRVLFCSNFCALNDWLYHRPVALKDLDIAVRAGYMGKRILRCIGESKTEGYFRHRSVLPHEGIAALPGYAAECQKRGLRLQLSLGHQFKSTADVLAFERAWMEAIHAHGLDETIALVELSNEYWQNHWMRGDIEGAAREGKAVRELMHSILSPVPLFAIGAPMEESPELIYQATRHSDLCEIHTKRDEEWMVKRVFGTWYMEGRPGTLVLEWPEGKEPEYKSTPKNVTLPGYAYWYGEPTPFAGGPDDFMGTSSAGRQIAQFAMQAMVSPSMTYFDGWDVRSEEPLDADAPTFESIPKFLAEIPENACTWPPVHGGSIWHWGEPGTQRFITVIEEQWYRDGYRPPKPVKTWTAYGPDNGVIGPKDGPIVFDAKPFGGALIVGEWA